MQSNGAANARGFGSSSERQEIVDGLKYSLTNELNELSLAVKKGAALEEEWWPIMCPNDGPTVESTMLLDKLKASNDKAHISVREELKELDKTRQELVKVQDQLKAMDHIGQMGAHEAQKQEEDRPPRAIEQTVSNAQSEGIWAVIIGINSYDHPDVKKSNLSGACFDAIAMSQYLLGDLAVPRSRIALLLSDTGISSQNSAQQLSSVHGQATDDRITVVHGDLVDSSVASAPSMMHSVAGAGDLEGICVEMEAKIRDIKVPIAMSEERIDCLGPDGMHKGTTNLTATRENILGALYDIRDNRDINRDDIIIIFFAGHGARWDFPGEKERHIETLCPSDRGMEDATGNIVPDITDRELCILLEELRDAKGDHIVVIMDCCHAGGMTRLVPAIGTVTSRAVSCIPGLNTYDLLRTASHSRKRSNKDPAADGWTGDWTTCVLLAACQPHEHAIELSLPNWDGSVRGRFTACLLSRLRQGPFKDYAELLQAIIRDMPKVDEISLQNPMFLNSTNKAYGPWFSPPPCKPEPAHSVDNLEPTQSADASQCKPEPAHSVDNPEPTQSVDNPESTQSVDAPQCKPEPAHSVDNPEPTQIVDAPQCKPEPTRGVYAEILPLASILLMALIYEMYRRSS
ncbi:hypothetical protein EIP86_004367 [Pleurotus ostreatoroseus]|nr:hypothetical protein EIP86_004367 [Pleurotus ostreatoroseus]